MEVGIPAVESGKGKVGVDELPVDFGTGQVDGLGVRDHLALVLPGIRLLEPAQRVPVSHQDSLRRQVGLHLHQLIDPVDFQHFSAQPKGFHLRRRGKLRAQFYPVPFPSSLLVFLRGQASDDHGVSSLDLVNGKPCHFLLDVVDGGKAQVPWNATVVLVQELHGLPGNVHHPEGERAPDLLQAVVTLGVVAEPPLDHWKHLVLPRSHQERIDAVLVADLFVVRILAVTLFVFGVIVQSRGREGRGSTGNSAADRGRETVVQDGARIVSATT